MSHMVNDPWLGQKKNLDYLLYNVLMYLCNQLLFGIYDKVLMLNIITITITQFSLLEY